MSKWTKIAIVVGANVALAGSVGLGLYFGIDRSKTTTTASTARTTADATMSQSITSTASLQSVAADHILAIWSPNHTVSKALVTSINGEVDNIKWDNEGEVSGYSYCSIQHKNQFFILGQVSLFHFFSLFDTFNN